MPTIVGDCKINLCVLLLQLHKPSNLQIYEGLLAFYLIFFPSCLCLSLWAGECVPRGTSQSSRWKRKREKIRWALIVSGVQGFMCHMHFNSLIPPSAFTSHLILPSSPLAKPIRLNLSFPFVIFPYIVMPLVSYLLWCFCFYFGCYSLNESDIHCHRTYIVCGENWPTPNSGQTTAWDKPRLYQGNMLGCSTEAWTIVKKIAQGHLENCSRDRNMFP